MSSLLAIPPSCLIATLIKTLEQNLDLMQNKSRVESLNNLLIHKQQWKSNKSHLYLAS
jgi:hypothetical protein